MNTIEKLARCFFEQGLAWQLRPSVTDELLRLLAQIKEECAELQRRQQPASVPAELVQQWWKEAVAQSSGEYSVAHYIVNRAAAYGREQALKEPPTC